MTRALLAVSVVLLAGCAESKAIVLRNPQGREVVCVGATTMYGVSHTLLSVQRQCVEDFERQGYEQVPDRPGKP